MYSEDVIRRVRDSVDIYDVVSGYVSLKKAGKNWLGLCPFHSEKTPSFNVNPAKQIFHCFGCGVGGDAFKFLELQEGLNFPEAVKQLASRAGITLPESRPRGDEKKSDDERKALLKIIAEAADYFRRELEGPAGSAARAYLAKRGLTETVIRDFSLGYARPEWDGLLKHLRQKGHPPMLLEKAGLIVKRSEGEGHYDRFRGRIIFPIRDISGRVIAFGGRVMDDSLPKYLNSPETPLYSKSNVLYCLDQAKEPARKQGYFIIVEGYLDAIACHQYGAKNAVATLGTALTDGHLRLMRRFAQKLMLIFDPDPAGVKATLRGFELFAGSGMKVNVVSLPDGDDPDTFLKKNGYEAFASCLKGSVKFMDFVLGQVVRSGSTTSIDEKVEQAGEMLGFIAKLPSGIERDHYLRRTAEALDVDEGLLRQEMTKQRTAHAGPRERTAAGTPPHKGQRPRAEEMLIHLMLRDETIARSLSEQITPEDFTDPLYRRAAERIFSVVKSGGELHPRSLAVPGDDELGRLISHYSVLEIAYSDQTGTDQNQKVSLEKTCADCVDRIRQHGSAKRMKSLLAAIHEAETRGDRERLRSLQEELVQIRRRETQ
ncbi:MAG: DNA primase [Nitrospirae bacterium]|nr:DNA primase [Nitrospirota bacterium]